MVVYHDERSFQIDTSFIRKFWRIRSRCTQSKLLVPWQYRRLKNCRPHQSSSPPGHRTSNFGANVAEMLRASVTSTTVDITPSDRLICSWLWRVRIGPFSYLDIFSSLQYLNNSKYIWYPKHYYVEHLKRTRPNPSHRGLQLTLYATSFLKSDKNSVSRHRDNSFSWPFLNQTQHFMILVNPDLEKRCLRA